MIKNYWWIAGLAEGKFVILGPYNTEEDANQLAMDKFTGAQYEVVELPTRDMVRATRLLKAGRLQDATLLEAIQRASHQLPEGRSKEVNYGNGR